MWATFTIVITSICCCCAVLFVVTERRRMKKGLTFAEAYSLPKAIVLVKAFSSGPDGEIREALNRSENTHVPHASLAEEVNVCVATPAGPNIITNPSAGSTVSGGARDEYTTRNAHDLSAPLVEALPSEEFTQHPHREHAVSLYTPPALDNFPEISVRSSGRTDLV